MENQWSWETPAPVQAATSVQVPDELAQQLRDEDSAYDTICKVYKDHLNKTPPEYIIEPVQGRCPRRAVLHLDTNHVIFTGFTNHFRYTTEGFDYMLDEAKKKAAVKAGGWLYGVLRQSSSIGRLANVSFPAPPVSQTIGQVQLLQDFMAHRAKTEEHLRLLHHSVDRKSVV